jgi:FixJ family two-component response regulator
MNDADSIVFVVDDDPSVREGLMDLASSVGLKAKAFCSAQDFLQHKRPDVPACLVLDVRLPGSSGMDLQRELARSEEPLPIIFITGHGDIPMSVRAMKAGAVEFLTKPFRELFRLSLAAYVSGVFASCLRACPTADAFFLRRSRFVAPRA